jgi:hypothetical protein
MGVHVAVFLARRFVRLEEAESLSAGRGMAKGLALGEELTGSAGSISGYVLPVARRFHRLLDAALRRKRGAGVAVPVLVTHEVDLCRRLADVGPEQDAALVSAALSALVDGRVDADWAGVCAGKFADVVLRCESAEVRDRAVGMLDGIYRVLGAEEADGEAWAWLRDRAKDEPEARAS